MNLVNQKSEDYKEKNFYTFKTRKIWGNKIYFTFVKTSASYSFKLSHTFKIFEGSIDGHFLTTALRRADYMNNYLEQIQDTESSLTRYSTLFKGRDNI